MNQTWTTSLNKTVKQTRNQWYRQKKGRYRNYMPNRQRPQLYFTNFIREYYNKANSLTSPENGYHLNKTITKKE